MGIAIIIPDVSFSESNIGQVTPTGNKPLVSLSISGDDSVIGREDAALYTVEYNPADTTQRGVVWSIVSGSAYATIDEGGSLTVLEGASESSVTIRATSSKNSSIYAEKTIAVTYERQFTPLEDLHNKLFFPGTAYFLTDIVLSNGDYIKAKFAVDTGIANTGTVVGSRTYSNADDNSNMIEVDKYGLSYKAIKCKIGGRYFYSNQAAGRYVSYTVVAKSESLGISPELGGATEGASYTYNSSSVPLGIGVNNLSNGVTSQLTGNVYGVEVYGSNDVLKHRLIPQSDLTFLDEVTGTTYSHTGTGTLQYLSD